MQADSATHADGTADSLLDGCFGRWPSEKAKEWVKAFVLAAREDASTAAVVLVGSIVRPVAQVQDADVLCVFHDKKMECAGHPLDVDLWSYTAADVPKLIAQGNDILGWAIKFGHLLCERGRYWTRLREVWLPKLPLPSAKVALKRARKAGKLCDELRKMGAPDAAAEERLTQLTHLARARLLSHGVYPASRPELPNQLFQIGEEELAKLLSDGLRIREEERQTSVFR